MRRRYGSEGVEDLAQLVYPLVANTDLAGDLQWLYAGAQAGLDYAAHRVAIAMWHHGGGSGELLLAQNIINTIESRAKDCLQVRCIPTVMNWWGGYG